MTTGVVYDLELVKVKIEQYMMTAGFMGVFERLHQPPLEFPAVHKISQAVMISHMLQSILGNTLGLAHESFTYFPINGRNQPGQVVLHDVILRTGFHGGNGNALPDRSGYDDYWQVLAVLLGQLQYPERREAGHVVVGNDDIPLTPAKGIGQTVFAVYQLMIGGYASFAHLSQ